MFVLFVTLVAPAYALAHDDALLGDDQIAQVIASCELKRDSSAAEIVGADEYVESCVTTDLSRLGKLRKYQKQYPEAYEACHRVQPYGLSATVICIESSNR